MEYTIKKGDNLWNLAKQYLGRGARWQEIAQANNMSQNDVLRPGMKITIPDNQQNATLASRAQVNNNQIAMGGGNNMTDSEGFTTTIQTRQRQPSTMIGPREPEQVAMDQVIYTTPDGVTATLGDVERAYAAVDELQEAQKLTNIQRNMLYTATTDPVVARYLNTVFRGSPAINQKYVDYMTNLFGSAYQNELADLIKDHPNLLNTIDASQYWNRIKESEGIYNRISNAMGVAKKLKQSETAALAHYLMEKDPEYRKKAQQHPGVPVAYLKPIDVFATDQPIQPLVKFNDEWIKFNSKQDLIDYINTNTDRPFREKSDENYKADSINVYMREFLPQDVIESMYDFTGNDYATYKDPDTGQVYKMVKNPKPKEYSPFAELIRTDPIIGETRRDLVGKYYTQSNPFKQANDIVANETINVAALLTGVPGIANALVKAPLRTAVQLGTGMLGAWAGDKAWNAGVQAGWLPDWTQMVYDNGGRGILLATPASWATSYALSKGADKLYRNVPGAVRNYNENYAKEMQYRQQLKDFHRQLQPYTTLTPSQVGGSRVQYRITNGNGQNAGNAGGTNRRLTYGGARTSKHQQYRTHGQTTFQGGGKEPKAPKVPEMTPFNAVPGEGFALPWWSVGEHANYVSQLPPSLWSPAYQYAKVNQEYTPWEIWYGQQPEGTTQHWAGDPNDPYHPEPGDYVINRTKNYRAFASNVYDGNGRLVPSYTLHSGYVEDNGTTPNLRLVAKTQPGVSVNDVVDYNTILPVNDRNNALYMSPEQYNQFRNFNLIK